MTTSRLLNGIPLNAVVAAIVYAPMRGHSRTSPTFNSGSSTDSQITSIPSQVHPKMLLGVVGPETLGEYGLGVVKHLTVECSIEALINCDCAILVTYDRGVQGGDVSRQNTFQARL